MTTHVLIAAVAIWVGCAVLAGAYGWAREFSPVATFVAALFLGFPLVVLLVAIGDGIRDSIEGGAAK
jgi:hypothetical protein